MKRIIGLSSIVLLSSTIFAFASSQKKQQISEKFHTKDLDQSINFGFSNTTGNADTFTLNGRYKVLYKTLGYRDEALKVAFNISAYMSKHDDIKKDEEFSAKLSLAQNISNGWAGYTSINWFKNIFFNVENKLSLGMGVHKTLYKNASHDLKMEFGFSYNQEHYVYTVQDNKNNKYIALNESISYNNQLNERSKLYFKVDVLQNFDNFSKDFEISAIGGLNLSVTKAISLSLEERIKHDTIPTGDKRTNTKTIIRVEYSF